jgi:uncharacterized membrane protein
LSVSAALEISVLAAIVAGLTGVSVLTGLERLLMIAAVLVYLLGVQLPTMIVNIPLNNQLQKIDVTTLTDTTRRQTRAAFEPRWNQWNVIRTVCAVSQSCSSCCSPSESSPRHLRFTARCAALARIRP